MAELNTNPTVTETANNNVAENNGGDLQGNTDNSVDAVSTSEKSEQTEKTFTQAELDAIVQKRIDRMKKDIPDKEQMKAFKEWQDSQKTAEQLSAEKVATAEKEKAEALQTKKQLEAKVSALTKGVKADAVDDVISLALAKVSDDVDINEAIDTVIKKYPAFCGNANNTPGITTGVNFGAGSPQLDGVEAAFLARNPNIKI